MPDEFNYTANQSQANANCEESTLPNVYARDQFFLENKFFLERDDSMTKEEYPVEESKIYSKNTCRRLSPTEKRMKKFGTF